MAMDGLEQRCGGKGAVDCETWQKATLTKSPKARRFWWTFHRVPEVGFMKKYNVVWIWGKWCVQRPNGDVCPYDHQDWADKMAYRLESGGWIESDLLWLTTSELMRREV